MAFIQSGAQTDASLATVDPTFKALRTTMRPPDMLTYIKESAFSGAITASLAAGSVVFTYKNSSQFLHVIRRISIGLNATTAFTQGSAAFGAYFNRTNFITQGTTNSTSFIGNLSVARTSLASSSATEYINTTTGITGDVTLNEDTVPFAICAMDFPAFITYTSNTISRGNFNGSGNTMAFPGMAAVDLFDASGTNSFPLVLYPNEGFRIKNDTIFPATGVATMIVNIERAEVASF